MTTTTTITDDDDNNNNSNELKLEFCDVGANLLEERFTSGIYRGIYRHESDFDLIIQRAIDVGITKIILTAGTIIESKNAVMKAREWNEKYKDIHFSCTVGVHPTRCKQVFIDDNENNDDEILIQELLNIALDGMKDNIVVAIGEIGLDYDRLEFCPKDMQQKYFIKQLQILAKRTNLPLFLHNRSVNDDLYNILKEYNDCWKNGGVVHSFDDTYELAMKFINDLDLYIGLNGCSLRTEENLQTAAQIPLERILLETDCPYCEVRKTHAGHKYITTHFDAKAEKKFELGKTVKSRQEPCHIIQIAEVIAGCKNISVQQVANTCYDNSIQTFFSTKK